MSPRASRRYQTMDIESMRPADRVVFLYTFLLAQLSRVKRAIAAGDVEARNSAGAKAQDVIEELLVSLDRDAGGQVADNLAALYAYFSKELVTIDMNSDELHLHRLISMVTSLREAWSQAAEAVSR